MIKTHTKHGYSFALIIEKPIKDADRQTRFKAALDTVNRKYSKALKKLAEWPMAEILFLSLD